MTSRWITAHAQDVPSALVARVQGLVPEADGVPVERLIDTATGLLRTIVQAGEGEGARAVALDLLAADACVTWAFEAITDPASLPAVADAAMQRITDALP
jgi:hypothetical protein